MLRADSRCSTAIRKYEPVRTCGKLFGDVAYGSRKFPPGVGKAPARHALPDPGEPAPALAWPTLGLYFGALRFDRLGRRRQGRAR